MNTGASRRGSEELLRGGRRDRGAASMAVAVRADAGRREGVRAGGKNRARGRGDPLFIGARVEGFLGAHVEESDGGGGAWCG